MKFGACIDWKDKNTLIAAKAAGAEFVEFGLSSFMDVGSEEIAELSAFLKEIDLPCLSYNLMLPGGYRVVGAEKDHAKAAAYVDKTLGKLSVLDSRNVVFGSCGSRNLRDGDDKDVILSDFVEFNRKWLAPVLKKHGFICSIEPLSECNLIHTVRDGADAVNAVGNSNVKLLYDFYHIWKNGESASDVASCCNLLNHVHVASVSLGRAVPRKGDGDEQRYVEMFRILINGGFDGTVSLEGGYKTDDRGAEMKAALDHLRECYDKA